MMVIKTRRWQRESDDDPAAGLVNLFDVWIVVVVALMLAVVATTSPLPKVAPDDEQNSLVGELVDIASQKRELQKFKRSDSPLTGEGELLGKAYRLKSGEIVYVPDSNR